MNRRPVHIREKAYYYNAFIRPEDVYPIAWKIMCYAPSPQQAMHQAFDFVIANIKYEKDMRIYNRRDVWQFPFETLRMGTGDCEDMAFLLASILIALGFRNTRVGLGTRKGEGHAWVEVNIGYRTYLLDCTHKVIYDLSVDKSQDYRVFYYIYRWGCRRPITKNSNYL